MLKICIAHACTSVLNVIHLIEVAQRCPNLEKLSKCNTVSKSGVALQLLLSPYCHFRVGAPFIQL